MGLLLLMRSVLFFMGAFRWSLNSYQNIMKAGTPTADASLSNGLKWIVDGSYNGSVGVWELVVDVDNNRIVHFLFRS